MSNQTCEISKLIRAFQRKSNLIFKFPELKFDSTHTHFGGPYGVGELNRSVNKVSII